MNERRPQSATERFLHFFGALRDDLGQHFDAAIQDSATESRPERKAEAVRVLKYEGNPEKSRVMFSIKMIGPLNALLPVMRELKARGSTILVRLSGDALERPHAGRDAFFSDFAASSDAETDAAPPNVIVRTTSDPARFDTQDMPEDAEAAHRERGARVVYFEDYPGNVGKIKGSGSPDMVLTMTDAAAHGAQAQFPGARVRATGRPDFDGYADTELVAENRRSGREALGVAPDEFLVVFSGQLPPSTITALQKVVRSLPHMNHENKKLVFLYSVHPGFTEERYPEDLKRLEELLAEVESAGVRVVRQGSVPTEQVGCAADLLINTHATEGLASVHRGVPTVYVGVPNDEKHAHHYAESRPNGAYPPPVEADAAFWIPDDATDEETAAELEAAIHEDDEREEKVTRGQAAFHADGRATERVADCIEELGAPRSVKVE